MPASVADRLAARRRAAERGGVTPEPASGFTRRPGPLAGLISTAQLPEPDGVARPSWTAKLDGGRRVNAAKALATLGWAGEGSLVAEIDSMTGLVPAVVLRPGRVTEPHQHRVDVDSDGRLSVPTTLRASLDVSGDAQLLLVALPDPAAAAAPSGVLLVYALAAVVPLLTRGHEPAAPSAPVPVPEPPAKRTSVRRPFQPPTDLAG